MQHVSLIFLSPYEWLKLSSANIKKTTFAAMSKTDSIYEKLEGSKPPSSFKSQLHDMHIRKPKPKVKHVMRKFDNVLSDKRKRKEQKNKSPQFPR